jgi:hypothetical protein
MKKLKSPLIDWLDEAIRLSNAFNGRPAGPIASLAELDQPTAWEPVHLAILHLMAKVHISAHRGRRFRLIVDAVSG